MARKNLKNLFIFVADALRYDYTPKSIVKAGTLVPTLAPSLYTPPSFASLVTSLNPHNHNVRKISDTMNPKLNTVFDLFKNGGYYDHPDDVMSKIVFKHLPKARELKETKEPFVVVERAMETHAPYGKVKHGNELARLKLVGGEYFNKMSKEGRIKREYRKGAKRVEKHFWMHLKELKEKGIFDRTLIVFTSDHGEMLGERYLFKKVYAHLFPPCKQLVKVPTVFLNQDLDIEFMRTIDIVPTCLGLMKKRVFKCDGVDVRNKKINKGLNFIQSPLGIESLSLNSLWRFSDGDIHLMNNAEIYTKSLIWAFSNIFYLKVLRRRFWY